MLGGLEITTIIGVHIRIGSYMYYFLTIKTTAAYDVITYLSDRNTRQVVKWPNTTVIAINYNVVPNQ